MSGSFGNKVRLTQEESLSFQGELHSIAGEVTIAAGASYKIGFISPKNFTFIHSRWRTGADRCRAYLYENISYTGGTPKAVTPRNRHINNPLQVTVFAGVTATVSNPISQILFGLKAAGEANIDEEFILKKNTPYVLELLNDATSQSDAVFYFIACCEYDLP